MRFYNRLKGLHKWDKMIAAEFYILLQLWKISLSSHQTKSILSEEAKNVFFRKI